MLLSDQYSSSMACEVTKRKPMANSPSLTWRLALPGRYEHAKGILRKPLSENCTIRNPATVRMTIWRAAGPVGQMAKNSAAQASRMGSTTSAKSDLRTPAK